MSVQRVALVTGASSGIGAETSRHLAARGYLVYAAARRVDRLEGLQEPLIRPLPMDVTDDDSMTSGVQHVLDEAGRIDALINNAGYGSYGAIEDVPPAEARRQFEVNVFGLARLAQLVAPHMRARGSGRIVNVSSMGGRFAMAFGGWYHATKHAVEGLSDAMRQELAPFGVQVVVIQPGGIRTEWAGISIGSALQASGDGAYAERVARMTQVLAGPGGSESGSDPAVVARAITRAVTARRPRTRYAIGLGAKPVMVARRVLPDRAMDAIMSRAIG